MDLSVLKKIGSRAVVALLGLTACMGTMQAANVLTATPTAVFVNCDPGGSSTTATVVVKPVANLTGTTSITVGLGTIPATVSVTPPGAVILNSSTQAAGLTYTIGIPNGTTCSSLPASATFNFKSGTTADVVVTVNFGSIGIAPSPSTFNLTCTKNGSTYTPGAGKTISVKSTTVGTTTVPFTVDTTATAWLTASASTGTATAAGGTFTLTAASGCGAFAAGTSNTGTIAVKVTAEPTISKTITVVLNIVGPSPLTFTPSAPSLTYVKGSGTAGKATVTFNSSSNPKPFFTVNTGSLPSWLVADSYSGNAPKSITFSSNTLADSLAPGTYTANVAISVSGSADLIVPFSMLVTNKAPSLTVQEGITRNISWVQGSSLPTPYVTAVSSDSPIPYTVTTGGTLQPTVSSAQQSGLAYSFGTQIAVTFNAAVFASAQPGNVLTGTVSLSWGTPASTIVVTFNVTVQSAGATVTGISPAGLPTAAAGQTFQVVLTGSGFVPGTDPTQKTKVGIVINGALVPDTNLSSNVSNSSNMIVTVTVPSNADANLPFSPTGTGGLVTLGVCNPVNGTCTIPTGQVSLTIGNNPIVAAVTSASAFIQVAPPSLQTVAAYDMASIFGTNFCSSGGTGCSSSQVLYGSPSTGVLQYPASLSPDATGATQRSLTVSFYQQGTTTLIANAPLLFATNGQINLVIPGGVSSYSSVDMIVNFGYGTGTTMKSSAPFTVNVAATNPGIFTIGQDGQGPGAVLDANYALVASTNPGAMRSTANDSDTVALYMTGLGVPDSTGDNSQAGTVSGALWSTDCVSPATFLSSLNSAQQASLTSLDGVVIQSALLNTNRFVPCIGFSSSDVPTVTVGGVSATVKYAGWVADTIAGLYQVNVKLPGTSNSFTTSTGTSITSITAPVQLPVVVTANGRSSQPGVTLWVAPRLLVAAPAALSGTVGQTWPTSNNAVVASEGTSSYRYALTSGLLPTGLSLGATTGAITGIPAANTAGTYTVTVTATDSANVPVTGTTTFTLTVAGGLYVTSTGTSPFDYIFGAAHASVSIVTATGGTYPYTYAITAPASIPTGMTVDPSSGVVGVTALTPGGTYPVTITATDSDATPLTGSANFTIVEALSVTNGGSVTPQNAGTAGSITPALTTTGQTGTVTYALDATTAALGWVTINSSTGAVAVTTSSVANTYSVTVTATDSTTAPGSTTAATGTYTFTMHIN
jgi:uncharacterized protein (TIGR03437 family)